MKNEFPSAINLKTGKLVPVASKTPILSSAKASWEGIIVEQHRLQPSESPELSLKQHSISIMLGCEYQVDWRLAGGKLNSTLMRQGEISITPKAIPTQARWFQDVEFLLISLDDSLLKKAVGDGIECDRIKILPQRGVADAHIFHLGMALKAEITDGCPSGKIFGESIANALAVHLVSRYSTQPLIPAFSIHLAQNQIHQVTDYINDNLGLDLSLTELAALVNISCYSFVRWFKAAIGVTPHQYIIQRRMELAKFLLTHTQLPIVEIALRVGCSSQSNFSVLFRKQVGVTPKVYRVVNGF